MQKKRIPGTPPGSQGPKFEDFDFAYESEQIQKMATQSDKANLADIDRQLAAANKEIERLSGRVSQLGRSGAQRIKAQEYENKVINTKRFLESEREQVVKILEEKKASLPQSYSSAAEEKNIARKAIQGPPQIKQAPVVEGPKYTAITNPMDPFTIGLEKAPAVEPEKPKPTAVGEIRRKKPTLKEVTLDTGEVIKYESPGSLVLPEVTVGRTDTGKVIKSTEPVKKYLNKRMLMSDQQVMEEYNKMGADYQFKLAQEQIDQAKYEFDYGKGEMKYTTGDEFERVSSQEMFVRSSGRDNQEVVPATEANKAAESDRIKRGGKEGTFERALFRSKGPEERARENAKIAREKSAANKRAIELQKAQDKNIRQAGNRRLTDTYLGTESKGKPFKVTPPKSKIKDTPKPKPGGSFEIPPAVKAAAAAKVAAAIKKSKGLSMLNVPIMTRGSAEQIFKDFLGKKDYSS